ncbi:MAG: phosphotransferase, partial [Chloroflexota bacterium]
GQLRQAIAQEERVYRELPDLLGAWAPAFYESFKRADWHVLLLEDVGPASVPPWTDAKARHAARSYGDFHRATFGKALPRWLPRRRRWEPFGAFWQGLAGEPGGLEGVASLAGDRAGEARAWLVAALPVLREASAGLARVRAPYSFLHFDTRSDNLRIGGNRVRIFDWNHACVGPPEFDAAAFAQSVACEGGPAPEQFMAWYAERQAVRDVILDRVVAAIAGYFANGAWRPAVPGLPRLRSVQRCQLRASLAWAARRLDLPEPSWLQAVPE